MRQATQENDMLTRFDPLFSDPFFGGSLLGGALLGGARARARRPSSEEATRAFVPPVDIWEDEAEVLLSAELPGLAESEIEVEVEDRVLTLRGRRERVSEEEKEGRFSTERRYGAFERSFRLPVTVDVANIEASMENGVLTLKLPKKPETQPRKIPIGGADPRLEA